MGELIRFVNRNKLLLIFLALQYICFLLIFQNNEHHKGVLLTTTNSLSGGLHQWTSETKAYFSLADQNEELRARVAELESSMPGSFRLIDNNFALINDTMFRRNYKYQYAHVIQSTTSLNNNYLTIDRGRAQDIKPGMIVRSNEGLVGQIERVTDNYSLVRPIIHPNFTAGAQIERTGNNGLLSWNTKDFKKAQLGDIPTEVKVKVGDRIITGAGKNSNYPKGIPIGVIAEATIGEGASFYNIDLDLAVDFSALNSVYIIGNQFVQELDSLQSAMQIDE
jgi:rod shape-determining protein MreC